MKELLESIIDNFSLSDIIALLTMISAIIAAIFAGASKRKAKESEMKAAKHAENADFTNQAAKKYYDVMCEILEKQNKREEKEELKKKILIHVCDKKSFTTQEIIENFEISESFAIVLLSELEQENKVRLMNAISQTWWIGESK